MAKPKITDGKYWKYRITAVSGRDPQAKVGDVHLYKRSRGKTHVEFIFDSTACEMGSWSMEKIGPCWVVGGKVVDKEPERASL